LAAKNRFAALAVTVDDVAALDQKVADDAMEPSALQV
jgi:hypothetical protein